MRLENCWLSGNVSACVTKGKEQILPGEVTGFLLALQSFGGQLWPRVVSKKVLSKLGVKGCLVRMGNCDYLLSGCG